jgi:hypothetical protein
MKPRAHILKVDPEFWIFLKNGEKPFEVRKDDRSYQVGDYLVLRQTEHPGSEMAKGAPLEYVDDPIVFRVTYALYIEAKFGPTIGPVAVMGIKPVESYFHWSEEPILAFEPKESKNPDDSWTYAVNLETGATHNIELS